MSTCSTTGNCPLCQGDNACRLVSVQSYKGPCWCEQTDIPAGLLEQLPEAARGRACICPTCVATFNRERAYHPKPGAGDHYYDASGRWVFTETYLRRRGYCCGSGCRHCPYPAHQPREVA